MRSAIDCFARAFDAFCRGVALSVGAAVIVTVLVISYGVLAREVLHLSDVWVSEVTTYLMAYMTFVGMAALAWQGRHLKVDIVSTHLGERGKRVLACISTLIVTAVALTMMRLAIDFWWDAWTSGERSWGMFSMQLWIPYSGFVAGMLLLCVAQVTRLLTIVFASEPKGREVAIDDLLLGRDE
ncbi:MAG TPA: TRAP transporter small permease [Paraburkholderia sp.]|jgi:TRAP-type C4-dicarboxylate transport system permease small subunit